MNGGTLGIVTARGGSKGLPGKNLRPLAGHPLVVWTVRAGLDASGIDRLILSTDDAAIAEAGRNAGADVPFLRPEHLASDTASSADVLRHALSECPGFDRFVLLQPTSPLRDAADIDAALAAMDGAGASGVVSVSAAQQSPWLMYRAAQNGRLSRLLPPPAAGVRRQDLPRALVLNGAIYVQGVQRFMDSGQLIDNDTIAYEMPAARAIDIDTAEDFAAAEAALLARRAP